MTTMVSVHPYTFHIIYKSISYLMSLSRRGPVKQSNPTFYNINMTKTIRYLVVARKFNQKWLQESLFAS